MRHTTLGYSLLIAAALFLAAHGIGAQTADGATNGGTDGGTDSATFLGLAIATDISEDNDGLTILDGVHNAVWSDSMPVTEDLQLYTRWSGTGTHDIGVAIVNKSTGDRIAEKGGELDFGEDPVSYATHDFSGTTFPSDGAYAIEVTIDGKPAATCAFYVNADDQLPDSPAFVLSVPAESGTIDDSGDLKVEGIFEYFTFTSFPATDTFSVVTAWFSGDGDFDHSVQILDPTGKQIAESPHSDLSASYGEMSVANDAFDSISFSVPGIYTAVVWLDGEKVSTFPLVITRQR